MTGSVNTIRVVRQLLFRPSKSCYGLLNYHLITNYPVKITLPNSHQILRVEFSNLHSSTVQAAKKTPKNSDLIKSTPKESEPKKTAKSKSSVKKTQPDPLIEDASENLLSNATGKIKEKSKKVKLTSDKSKAITKKEQSKATPKEPKPKKTAKSTTSVNKTQPESVIESTSENLLSSNETDKLNEISNKAKLTSANELKASTKKAPTKASQSSKNTAGKSKTKKKADSSRTIDENNEDVKMVDQLKNEPFIEVQKTINKLQDITMKHNKMENVIFPMKSSTFVGNINHSRYNLRPYRNIKISRDLQEKSSANVKSTKNVNTNHVEVPADNVLKNEYDIQPEELKKESNIPQKESSKIENQKIAKGETEQDIQVLTEQNIKAQSDVTAQNQKQQSNAFTEEPSKEIDLKHEDMQNVEVHANKSPENELNREPENVKIFDTPPKESPKAVNQNINQSEHPKIQTLPNNVTETQFNTSKEMNLKYEDKQNVEVHTNKLQEKELNKESVNEEITFDTAPKELPKTLNQNVNQDEHPDIQMLRNKVKETQSNTVASKQKIETEINTLAQKQEPRNQISQKPQNTESNDAGIVAKIRNFFKFLK